MTGIETAKGRLVSVQVIWHHQDGWFIRCRYVAFTRGNYLEEDHQMSELDGVPFDANADLLRMCALCHVLPPGSRGDPDVAVLKDIIEVHR